MTLHIDKLGGGPLPMVLLHGWAMHGGVMQPLVDALEAQCTLYVVDLPGHGLSRSSPVPLEPHACAAAIAALTPPAIWVGWSLGGLIALTAALDLPHRVRGLGMLCATPKFVRDASWPHGSDPAFVQQLAASLQTDYHTTLEHFLALEAMGSADPRAELRQLRALVFSRGEPDVRV
ncbi:MAG: alpha/beta fold hydrolase, partial [Rhodanobacter sp.]